jgi:Mn-dependent DtxR family transcriptional regulator
MKKTSTNKPEATEPATASQLKVLKAVMKLVAEKKISPTYEEIAKEIEGSKSNVKRAIAILVRKGLLHKSAGHRSLVVTDYGKIVARKRTK